MSVMDAYTKELLALAVDEAAKRSARLTVEQMTDGARAPVWLVGCWLWSNTAKFGSATGPTLAEALTALLADLGVEVPERPSAVEPRVHEAVAEAGCPVEDYPTVVAVLTALRHLHTAEPLTVLAFLEGESA